MDIGPDIEDLPGITVHVPFEWLDTPGIVPGFYSGLVSGLESRDIPVSMIELNYDTLANRLRSDQSFHILHQGRYHHPRAMMSGPSYLLPYWSLDATGFRASSSIARRPFRAKSVDGEKASAFFKDLRARTVEKRVSRREQPEHRAAYPARSIAVFLQDETRKDVAVSRFLTGMDMLRTVLDTTDRPVIVKPHPADHDAGTMARLDLMKEDFPNLHISQGNLHDIIEASDRIVTINSSVAVEAYLHRTPVILCGHCDFHHIADTARTRDELMGHLRSQPQGRVWARFLYWYFAEHCIDVEADDIAGQVLARIAQEL